MKKIPLSRNKFALVDDDMFEYLNQFKWYCDSEGYVIRGKRINGKTKRISMARLIMGNPIGKMIDHKNHNLLDNCRNNLRICTDSQNLANQQKTRGTSQFKGVSWHKNRPKKWVSSLQIDYKRIHLGYFDSEIEAAKAYDKTAKKLFGQFAHLNFERENYVKVS